MDGGIAGVDRTQMIRGELPETLPKFVKQHSGVRLSLLYLDTNLFESTLLSLRFLYPLVVPGGIVAFNGLSIEPWAGESADFHEFFCEGAPKLKTFPFLNIPSAHFVKE